MKPRLCYEHVFVPPFRVVRYVKSFAFEMLRVLRFTDETSELTSYIYIRKSIPSHDLLEFPIQPFIEPRRKR